VLRLVANGSTDPALPTPEPAPLRDRTGSCPVFRSRLRQFCGIAVPWLNLYGVGS
jgi:hypothetical protein